MLRGGGWQNDKIAQTTCVGRSSRGYLSCTAAQGIGGGTYRSPGVLFGGVDAGPAFPLNALNRFTDVGGFIMPFVGYKFFQDKDLQLNPGHRRRSMQFFGMGASGCFTNSSCFAFHNSQDHRRTR